MNLYLWGKIKKLNIDFFMKAELFSLVEKYLDRVKFVTRLAEGKDNLFLAERVTGYEYKTYVSENNQSITQGNLEGRNQKNEKETNFIRIMSSLRSVFEETDRILYITIGFEEPGYVSNDSHSYWPSWYLNNCSDIKRKRFDENTENIFRNVIAIFDVDKTNRYINELLSQDELTNEDKHLLRVLSTKNKIKTPV